MARTLPSAAVSVERFFQFSLLGLVASGYLAVAGSGYLDLPTIVLTAAGLVLRGLLVCGAVRLEISDRVVAALTLAYAFFFAADYLLLSRDFLQSTVHLVFFLAVMKILTARTSRDYLYTAIISFLELLAAALLSINLNFFAFLAMYLFFAMAALTSGEIRRSIERSKITARAGPRRFHPRLAGLTAIATLGILLLTACFFFILPRTADAALSRLVSHRILLPGFSNQVTLGEIGEVKNTSRPVMHVRVFAQQSPQNLKWRGGALAEFDGKRWSNPPSADVPVRLAEGEARLLSPPYDLPGINYHVDLNASDTDAVFLAGIPVRLEMRQPVVFRTRGDGYRLSHPPFQGFRYDAYSMLQPEPESVPPRRPPPVLPLSARERFLQLPRLDPRIAGLAREWTAGAQGDLERARIVERRLRAEYGYTIEMLSADVPDPLAHFLFTRRKGHCEYFASAMAVMLRTLGIPARLANGFQTGTWNSITEMWLVRSSDAHSWVEAWIPGYGWTTFDPTPPDPAAVRYSLLSLLGLYADAAETFWREWVVGYDVNRQGTLADRMEQGARRMGIRWFDGLGRLENQWRAGAIAFLRGWGMWLAGGAAAAVAIWFAGPPLLRLIRVWSRVRRVRRGQASVADATLLYHRMLHLLRRRGYHKPTWFTPREFADSLPAEGLRPVVAEFTEAYNELRFGGHGTAAARLSELLDRLERQPR